MSRIFVAELVAVDMMHPTVAVDVADCAFKRVRSASAVTLPDIAVVLAERFLMVSLLPSVSCVVVAPARSVARPAMLNVPLPVVLILPAVVTFVLMVVAAWAMPALTKTTARPKRTVRVVLPRPFTYVLMLFINYDCFWYE